MDFDTVIVMFGGKGGREMKICTTLKHYCLLIKSWNFSGWLVVKNSPSNVGSMGLIPGWGAKATCFVAKKPKHKTETILKQIQ